MVKMLLKLHDMYCTYIHRTIDENKIFYVGKGCVKRKRAFSYSNRNKHWHNVVKKHGLNVEIVSYWNNENDALEHEKFLISTFLFLGKKLVNQTDGGDGVSGWKHNNEFKLWQSERLKEEYKDPIKRQKKADSQKRRFESLQSRREHSEKIKNSWTDEKRKKASESTKKYLLTNKHSCLKVTDEIFEKMKKLRKDGNTYTKIGILTGFSKSRVRTLLMKESL